MHTNEGINNTNNKEHPNEHDDHDHAIPHKEDHHLLSTLPPSPFVLYRRRWFVLAIFCLLTMSNAMMWITFSPISTYVEEYYHISNFNVNMLSLVYMILYIPFVFLSSWIIDQKGLRLGILVGSIANCLGAWIRCIPHSFAAVMAGQCVAAFAQTFLLSAPVKLAANWFGHDERTTATSIGALCNQLGVALGFYLSPTIATRPDKITELLLVQALITSAILVVVLLGIRSSTPPTPPSHTAATEKTQFFQGIRSLFFEVPFWVLLIGFGMGVGVFYDICTLLNQLLDPYKYSQSNSGLLGTIILVVGLFGAIIAGPVLDRTKSLLAVISFVGLVGGVTWFTFSLKPHNFLSLAFSCGVIGFFATAMLPVCLESGVECTYPVAEGLSSGILLMAAQVFGIVFTLTLSSVQTKYGTIATAYTQLIFAGAAMIIMFFFKTEYKRQNAEQAAH